MSNSLSYKYRTANILVKIIAINAIIYLVFAFGETMFRVYDPASSVRGWFMLPTDLGSFALKPWSIVTYAFFHNGFFHVLWNMLFLYWFGGYVLNLFTSKRLLTLYFLGAIYGGLLYLLCYNLFPLFDQTRGLMQGASAAVYAVMVFIATYSPNAQMRVFVWNIKLWQIALFFVLKDFVVLTGSSDPTANNAGGLIAHMGGAIFGYVYAVQLTKGRDIGAWFDRLMDWLVGTFSSRKSKPFKKVHKNKTTTRKASGTLNKDEHQQKIDAILDKISKSGYDSLSKQEKDFLFKAGNDKP